MNRLSGARFFTTVAKPSQLPGDGLGEIAFVGRSNAGKSSAINALCHQKRLAFSSKTPGRTQALNFFGLGQRKPEDAPQAFLVDTPGYGYAEATREAQAEWARLSGTYLGARKALRGVVLVMDIRRGVTDKDRQLIGFCPEQVPILILLSKADKLSKLQQNRQMQQVRQDLTALRPAQVFEIRLFSVPDKQGQQEVAEWICGGLGL